MEKLYSRDELLQIWAKGIAVDGYNPQEYRQDVCGAWMHFSKYGDRGSKYGWEVDHIFPKSKANELHKNSDFYANLRPLQWENNKSKGTDYPIYKATVRAEEGTSLNVDDTRTFRINDSTQNTLRNYFQL